MCRHRHFISHLVVDAGGVLGVNVVVLEGIQAGPRLEEALQIVGRHFALQLLGVCGNPSRDLRGVDHSDGLQSGGVLAI